MRALRSIGVLAFALVGAVVSAVAVRSVIARRVGRGRFAFGFFRDDAVAGFLAEAAVACFSADDAVAGFADAVGFFAGAAVARFFVDDAFDRVRAVPMRDHIAIARGPAY